METYIRVPQGFRKDLRTKRIMSEVGSSGVIAIIDLWLYAALHNPDGVLDVSKEDLLLICDIGNKKIIDLIIEYGFLEETKEGFVIENWDIISKPKWGKRCQI